MKFRTEIERISTGITIGHSSRMLMVGSCFTDNIGGKLAIDGFDTLYNPMGPLYNPLSIARCLRRALSHQPYTAADLTEGPTGYHCLDYASRYCGSDVDLLLERINSDFAGIDNALTDPRTDLLIVTFGSAWVFEMQGTVVGNCHKFPADMFERRHLSVEEICTTWQELLKSLPTHIKCIFTVSPIRHLADGLHGNQISKATLLLAAERLSEYGAEYFPAYEILLDDLRDYRFYAADMKHPSDTAVEYIYDIFSDTYMSDTTRRKAAANRRAYLASQHRQILPSQS